MGPSALLLLLLCQNASPAAGLRRGVKSPANAHQIPFGQRTGLDFSFVAITRMLEASQAAPQAVVAKPAEPLETPRVAAEDDARPLEEQRDEWDVYFENRSFEPVSGPVGVLKEIKADEMRVGLTPVGVGRLTRANVEVIVERGAGRGSGFSDAEYERAGARMVDGPAEVFGAANIIKHVKELQPSEYKLLRSEQVVFTYNHFEEDAELARRSIESRASFISYEKVVVGGKTPLLAPMSRIAGVEGAQWAEPAGKRVVVLGGGEAGAAAARRALELGAVDVVVTEKSADRRAELQAAIPGARLLDSAALDEVRVALRESDVIIGAVYVRGKAPILIGHEGQVDDNGQPTPFTFEDISVRNGKPKTVVDIAVDQGGNAAYVTDRVAKTVSHDKTDHQNKVALDAYNNRLLRVPNMPAAVPRQASIDLEEATLPYLWALAADYIAAMIFLPELSDAESIGDGRIMDRQVWAAYRQRYPTWWSRLAARVKRLAASLSAVTVR